MNGFLIQSALEHHARERPDHPALSCAGESWSYAELDRAANRLAHALRAGGAVQQDRVGILMHKRLELGAAIYGALKAGCVFVPLDPFTPPERLRFVVEDCGIRHIVGENALAGALEGFAADTALTVYGVDDASLALETVSPAAIDAYSDTAPELALIDQDLGYIMYTSGSTGMPKGMMHTHVGSNTYARWGAEHVGLTPADRVASHAPLHFDLSVFDFFSTARAGATVALVPHAVTRLAASWTKTIESERISVVFTVPYTLLTMLDQGAMDRRDLSSLRWILFGGEPFPPRRLRQLMEALPGVRFTNVYGPAEAPSCTCHDVRPDDVASDDPLPIGRVSRNSVDLVVDENDEHCGIDRPGELCIRSTSLTRGYWNRPDLNARVYLLREGHGPFPEVYFRTGDRVVRRGDGLLHFLGRTDRMIKTRGHRVELDEVEAALAAHEAVSEAAAFTVPDDQGSQLVFAAVTVHESERVDGDALLRHARERLPPYALPREVSLHDSLPHTSSGKIDRRRLVALWKESRQA